MLDAAAMQAFCNQSCSTAGFAANKDRSVIIQRQCECSRGGTAYRRCAADEIHQIAIQELTSQFFVFANQFPAFQSIQQAAPKRDADKDAR